MSTDISHAWLHKLKANLDNNDNARAELEAIDKENVKPSVPKNKTDFEPFKPQKLESLLDNLRISKTSSPKASVLAARDVTPTKAVVPQKEMDDVLLRAWSTFKTIATPPKEGTSRKKDSPWKGLKTRSNAHANKPTTPTFSNELAPIVEPSPRAVPLRSDSPWKGVSRSGGRTKAKPPVPSFTNPLATVAEPDAQMAKKARTRKTRGDSPWQGVSRTRGRTPEPTAPAFAALIEEPVQLAPDTTFVDVGTNNATAALTASVKKVERAGGLGAAARTPSRKKRASQGASQRTAASARKADASFVSSLGAPRRKVPKKSDSSEFEGFEVDNSSLSMILGQSASQPSLTQWNANEQVTTASTPGRRSSFMQSGARRVVSKRSAKKGVKGVTPQKQRVSLTPAAMRNSSRRITLGGYGGSLTARRADRTSSRVGEGVGLASQAKDQRRLSSYMGSALRDIAQEWEGDDKPMTPSRQRLRRFLNSQVLTPSTNGKHQNLRSGHKAATTGVACQLARDDGANEGEAEMDDGADDGADDDEWIPAQRLDFGCSENEKGSPLAHRPAPDANASVDSAPVFTIHL